MESLYLLLVIRILLYILPIILSVILARTYIKRRGKQGEHKVAKILKRLDKTKYITVNDLLTVNNENYTQIDHIVFSIYGIFVIETKNYSGWIYGSEYADEWIQNKYGNKYPLHNPLKQNYGHIKVLSNLLKIDEDKFISIVAFSNEAELKSSYKQSVVNFRNLKSCILAFQTPVFTFEEISNLSQEINKYQITNKRIRKEHINKIDEKLTSKQAKIDNGYCPKCNGKLVERTGKYGKFLGCSNYPNCKFTYNLSK